MAAFEAQVRHLIKQGGRLKSRHFSAPSISGNRHALRAGMRVLGEKGV